MLTHLDLEDFDTLGVTFEETMGRFSSRLSSVELTDFKEA